MNELENHLGLGRRLCTSIRLSFPVLGHLKNLQRPLNSALDREEFESLQDVLQIV